jgi:predicted Zn-dependent protease
MVSAPAASDEVIAHVLRLVERGEAEVIVSERDLALTRFAASRIHQNVSEHDATVRVRIVDEGRTGVASTNRLDETGLREVVARAAAIAERARPNPNGAPIPDASEAIDSDLGHVEATAHADPQVRADGAREVIEAALANDLVASGAFSTEGRAMAVANSRGLRSSHRSTEAKLVTVLMRDRASGYAQAVAGDVRDIDAAAAGREAADKAVRSVDPMDLEPGSYPVVLEPYAVGTVLEYLSLAGLSALAVEEGRSFMELGSQVMGSNVRIWDDGLDPSGIPSAIDFEGVAKQRVDLVRDGVAVGVVHDSATARRAGIASTGHGLPAPNTWGPLAWNLFMAGGQASSTESLTEGIERGIWVTRFHYVNIVHPRKAVLTGMTKDGTFLIENGRIGRPIRNLRFTQSIPEAFSRIEAATAETRLTMAEYTGIATRIPALRVGSFTFTGATADESAE